MDTDDALTARLATDLDGSFEALVRAHQDRLYTIAARFLGDRHDAEEIAQDALVRAYRALAEYDTERIRALRLRAWLATIVLNLCRNRVARRSPGATPLSLDLEAEDGRGSAEPASDPTASPPAILERREARRRWAALVRQLPPMYRAPVVLRHVDGLSYPELALVLDRPEGTIKAQVHRGLALLRTAFEAAERLEREEMTA
ncbi:MAG TPA: sigma-70 family RNA polymerase sigma factor [Clostridia bacterium]|nr:sigma-70 family RNA polymerase sigma factor [Clostridia bacterium]